MIEVKIDVTTMDRITHDVSHSIQMVKSLKEAGLPFRGILLAKGVERGTMVWSMDEDLDGDTWLIRWYDTHEKPEHKFKEISAGHGHAYTFRAFEDLTVPPPYRPEDDEL